MASDPDRVVWDSCVIIDAIQKTSDRYQDIEPFLLDAERGKLQIVVSETTVAEVNRLDHLGEQGIDIENQARLIRDWFENPYIVRRPVHPGISELAAEIGRKYGIKRVGDTIVLATALFDNIGVVHTYDGEGSRKGLLDFDGQIGDPPLRITTPNYAQGTLFDKKGL